MVKSGMISGPSHENGGIGIKVIETGRLREVEGGEYFICQNAMYSTKTHEFKDKTAREILDALHSEYFCREFNSDLNAQDFIVCKAVVENEALHTITGSPKEILNILQAQSGCYVMSKSDYLAKGGPVDADIDQGIMKTYAKLSKNEAANVYQRTLEIIRNNEPLTAENRLILEKYEGRGSVLNTGKVDEGLVHQFYTPYIVGKKMYDLAQFYGFRTGRILEPSCGTGRFFKFAPVGSELIGFDLDETNIQIAKKLYPGATFYKQEFETAFLQPPLYTKAIKKSWLPEFDLVIGNPPYGDYQGYFKSYMPSVYKRFEFLFIRLGLQALKPGGLLVFIISQNLMNNGAMYNNMKKDILSIGTFVDAFRMPNGIFTSTEVGTDIVIFRRK